MPIVTASSFADPADVAAYRAAIRKGIPRSKALLLGDDGMGEWGDPTTSPRRPMCALPPEDVIARWGTIRAARGKRVRVTWNGRTIVGELRDLMPSKRNITNGAGIDLNPGFARAFAVEPPFLLPNVRWEWADPRHPAATSLLRWLLSDPQRSTA